MFLVVTLGGANGIWDTAGVVVCWPADRLDVVRHADAESFG